MKKFKFAKIMLVLAVMLFGGMNIAQAATTLPDAVISDNYRIIEYIDNFRVIVKTSNSGKYYIYCMNMTATYEGGVKFSKTGAVDDGFVYILNNVPNTGDQDKDFYITQMAVWYYEDYLNQNNANLESVVKKYIIKHRETEEVSKGIYDLYEGAKYYKAPVGELDIEDTVVTFGEKDGYYVSSEIKVYEKNLNSKVKYSLTNAPQGSQIVKSENGVKVKVPVDKVDEGKKIDIKMNVQGSYTKYTGYYYYHSSKYQNILFQDPLEENAMLYDSITMTVSKKRENFEVNISKTDITQTKEIPGATLELKGENGTLIEKWVSTNESHVVTLKAGKYSLTETIAPKGYKLSKTTIEFQIDNGGNLYVKEEDGKYTLVKKINMINELLDVVSFAKKDKDTKKFVSGATLVIKDAKGAVVKEFITDGKVFSLELNPGDYSLEELAAPEGYVLSNEVIYFTLMEDGTLKVKNNKGEYADSVIVTFYNVKEEEKEVPVPATDLDSTMLIIGGITLLIGGIAYARKVSQEC